MPLTPGTRLGPFEIVAPLGAGGMGQVYRGREIPPMSFAPGSRLDPIRTP